MGLFTKLKSGNKNGQTPKDVPPVEVDEESQQIDVAGEPAEEAEEVVTPEEEAEAEEAEAEEDVTPEETEEAAKEEGNDDEDDNDDAEFLHDDDDLPPPPPPTTPPPPELLKANNTASNDSSSRKKKLMIGAAAGVACALALGLGLGLGLDKNKSSSSDKDAAPSNLGEGDEVGTGPVEEEDSGAVSTTATSATTVASTPTTTEVVAITWVTENVDDGSNNVPADEVIDTTADETTTASPSASPSSREIETYDAVIIGAGWSGIRATETLLNAGIDSLIVLEANNYIGGRSKTQNSDGSINNPDMVNTNNDNTNNNVPHDIGSEWLYTNGVMEEAFTQRGYVTSILNNDKNSVDIMDATYYQQSKDAETGEWTAIEFAEGEDWFNEIWGGFIQFRENRLEEDLMGLSYQEAIDRYIERWEWTDDNYLQLLNLVEEAVETDYTADSSQLSVEEVEFFPPGYSQEAHYMSVPGVGFGNVAARYADPIKDKIKLNSKVIEINSDDTTDDNEDEDGMTTTLVKYMDENGVEKEIKAKTVLVTVSLGVLKAGTINFVPPLPDNKQDSIDNMGFGVVNKCIMSWDNDEDMVWPEDQLWMLLITPEDETSGEWTQFSNPSKFKGKPSLTAWVGGEEALVAETKTDGQIMSRVMRNLRSMFPTIRDPDNVIISRWGQEENVLGTYSFPIAGRDFYDDADNLAERFNDIWFSGEATGSGWATTTGAWRTGQRAAEDMIGVLQS